MSCTICKYLNLYFVFQSQNTKADIFEGPVRFYINDDNAKLSKAIRMRTTDDIGKLLPVLKNKFGFSDVQLQQARIVQVAETGEGLWVSMRTGSVKHGS